MKDYYRILGVDRGASQSDIQRAFRALAKKHHPDAGGDSAKFKEVNEAYQVLNNPEKRRQYDAGAYQGPGGGAGFSGFDFSHFDMGGSSLEDILSGVFSGMMGRGRNVQIDIQISFKESIFGVEKTVNIPYRTKATQSVKIQIPGGIENGQGISIEGKGEEPKDSRFKPGNLIVVVHVEKHPHFSRHGRDLVRVVEVPLSEALLGTTKQIDDLEGKSVSITVPELTREGDTVSISGHGIPSPVGSGRLVILFHIVYPKKLSAEDREHIEALKRSGV